MLDVSWQDSLWRCLHTQTCDKYVRRDISVKEKTKRLMLMYFQAYLKSRKKVLYLQDIFLGNPIVLYMDGFLSMFYSYKGVFYYHRFIYYTLQDAIVKLINLWFDVKRSLKISRLGII